MSGLEIDIIRFSNAFERLILKMQEVNDSCVQLTQDITKQELSLLGFIGNQGFVIMRDIVEYLEVPYSTSTGIVDKLVSKEYLIRYNSEEDRRTVLVKLSKKGNEVFDLFRKLKFEMGQLILGDLSPDDREKLINLMEKVMINLKNKHIEDA